MREILEPTFESLGLGERVTLEGPSVPLPPKDALSLTLAFHELATNATAYGALSTEGGKVEISWTLVAMPAGDQVRIVWRESGGPLVAPPASRGFGRRLIERGLAQGTPPMRAALRGDGRGTDFVGLRLA